MSLLLHMSVVYGSMTLLNKKKVRAGITDYGQLLDQDGEMYDVPSIKVLLEN